jgi:hypothetical protein
VLKIEGCAKAGRTTVRVKKQHADRKTGEINPEQQVNLKLSCIVIGFWG